MIRDYNFRFISNWNHYFAINANFSLEFVIQKLIYKASFQEWMYNSMWFPIEILFN